MTDKANESKSEKSIFLETLHNMYPQLEHYYIIPKSDSPEKWVEFAVFVKPKDAKKAILKWREEL